MLNEPGSPKTGKGLQFAYGAGAFGALLCFAPVPLLLLYYLTEFAGISPAVAGIILAIPKFFDLLLDPWIGRTTDRFAAAYRSRAVVILLSSLVLPLSLIVLFAPFRGPLWMLVLVYAALLVVQSYLITAFSVAHTGLAGDLSEHAETRASLFASRAFGSAIAGLAVSAGAPVLISAFGGKNSGYLAMSLLLAVFSASGLLWCYRMTRGTALNLHVASASGMERASEKASLWQSLRGTFNNRSFYAVALMLVLIGTGTTCFLALLPYVNKYILVGAADHLAVLLVPIFVALLVGVTLAPGLLRRLGQVRAIACGFFAAASGMLVFWSGLWQASQVLLVSGCIVFGLGSGMMTVLISAAAMQVAMAGLSGSTPLGLYLGILFSAEKLGQSGGRHPGRGWLVAGGRAGGRRHSQPAVRSTVGIAHHTGAAVHVFDLPDRAELGRRRPEAIRACQ